MNRVAESISLSLEVRIRSHQGLLEHLLLRAYRLKLLLELAVLMLVTFALFQLTDQLLHLRGYRAH